MFTCFDNVIISGDRDWPSCLSVRLHPATGDVQEQQYVCLTLELTPPHDVSNPHASASIVRKQSVDLPTTYMDVIATMSMNIRAYLFY